MEELKRICQDRNSAEYDSVSEALKHLALCHEVIIDPSTGKYNASSPDEQALVDGAAVCGFKFYSRDSDMIIEIKIEATQEKLKYKLLNILPFNSTRKRMSVVVNDLQTDQIVLLCKGADSIIE